MWFGFHQETLRLQIGNDPFPGIETIHALIVSGRQIVDFSIQGKDIDRHQVMTLPDLIVIEIMRWGNFHATSTEFPINISIGNNRNGSFTQRQAHMASNQMLIAQIFGMHSNSHVPQHGLRARGGDNQGFCRISAIAIRLLNGIANMPHGAIFFRRHHFQIRDGRLQDRIPIHQALAAIDEPFTVKPHKHFSHCAR